MDERGDTDGATVVQHSERSAQPSEQYEQHAQGGQNGDGTPPDDANGQVPGETNAESTSRPLFEADERQSMISRWREIQAEFVDEPKRAMRDADTLVTELMQRLTRHFAEEHERLGSWRGHETISTEDLRQRLHRYRSFFERLLET